MLLASSINHLEVSRLGRILQFGEGKKLKFFQPLYCHGINTDKTLLTEKNNNNSKNRQNIKRFEKKY